MIRSGEIVQGKLRHVLSFDVEEHFQVAAFWSVARRREWDQLASRVECSTRKIADLLSEHSIKATVFVLGWVAERHPKLVMDIAQRGHEIASHGYTHELITAQTPYLFREDMRTTKNILEQLTGKAVLPYRAPSSLITPETQWALPISVEEGYRCHSSISFPSQPYAMYSQRSPASPLLDKGDSQVALVFDQQKNTDGRSAL